MFLVLVHLLHPNSFPSHVGSSWPCWLAVMVSQAEGAHVFWVSQIFIRVVIATCYCNTNLFKCFKFACRRGERCMKPKGWKGHLYLVHSRKSLDMVSFSISRFILIFLLHPVSSECCSWTSNLLRLARSQISCVSLEKLEWILPLIFSPPSLLSESYRRIKLPGLGRWFLS